MHHSAKHQRLLLANLIIGGFILLLIEGCRNLRVDRSAIAGPSVDRFWRPQSEADSETEVLLFRDMAAYPEDIAVTFRRDTVILRKIVGPGQVIIIESDR